MNRYAPEETNPLYSETYHHLAREPYTLARLQANGGKITRLRMFATMHPGDKMYEISYIHGELPNGQGVRIIDTPDLTYGRTLTVHQKLWKWAYENDVYPDHVDLLNEANWSILN